MKRNDKKLKTPTVVPVSVLPEVKNLKVKEEEKEVAGRHKNDGQSGHKGAR